MLLLLFHHVAEQLGVQAEESQLLLDGPGQLLDAIDRSCAHSSLAHPASPS